MAEGETGPTAASLSALVSEPYAFARRLRDTESDTGYDTRWRASDGARADALQAAGVDAGHVYHDVASGVRDDRPGLDSCVRALRPGDVLVVWKLDRLGRTLAHLVNTVQTLSASAASTMRAHASTSDPASW